MSIEPYKGEALPASRALEPRGFDEAWRLAQVAHKSGLCGVASAEAAFVIIGTGLELGLTAMQSLLGIYTIDGKPALYAQTMRAIVRQSGLCTLWRYVERTATKCVIEVQRKGDDAPVRFEWSIERASKITLGTTDKPLTSKVIWKNHPTEMLDNRCTSEACRVLFSDLLLGLRTPEEMEALVDGEVEVVESKPAPAQRATVTLADAPPVQAPATPPPFVPPAGDNIDEWKKKFEACTTAEDLAALTKSAPPKLQKELMAAYKAAKARITGKDDGPKGGGSPKPAAPEQTDATGSGEHAQASDSATPAAILAQWTDHLSGINTPQHVLNSVAAHVDDFDPSMRSEVMAAAARRLRAFKWAEGKDCDVLVREAVAQKAAA
jgi:hypothetical protein